MGVMYRRRLVGTALDSSLSNFLIQYKFFSTSEQVTQRISRKELRSCIIRWLIVRPLVYFFPVTNAVLHRQIGKSKILLSKMESIRQLGL